MKEETISLEIMRYNQLLLCWANEPTSCRKISRGGGRRRVGGGGRGEEKGGGGGDKTGV